MGGARRVTVAKRATVGLLIGLAGASAAAVALAAVRSGADPAPFASLRQTTVQEIPGTLTYTLAPPPSDYRPRLGPATAVRRLRGVDPDRAAVALATIRDALRRGAGIGPAWVVVARGICVRSSKGELVSDARGSDPTELACSDRWLWVAAVDAGTGRLLLSIAGYDETRTWAPSTADPAA